MINKYRNSVLLFLVLSFPFYTGSQGSEGSEGSDKLVILYTGDLRGELEPCGCAEETDLGGIRRRASVVEQQRELNQDLILVSAGGLISSNTWQDKIKAEYIYSAMNKMAFDSVGVQWRDLSYGAEFATSVDVPWVSGNWEGNGIDKKRTIRRGDIDVSLFSWLDPEGSVSISTDRLEAEFEQSAVTLNRELKNARARGELTLLTSSINFQRAKELVNLEHVDVLILPNADEKYGEPELIENTLVLRYGTRGMRIGKLSLDTTGETLLDTASHEVFTLDDSTPDSSSFDNWYEEYNEEVKSEYYDRISLRNFANSDAGSYVGASSCAGCHKQKHDVWSRSKHANAFQILQLASKQFDPSCVGCHSVGFEKPGGFIDMALTDHLANVQCESCHGPARDHIQSGGIQSPVNASLQPREICLQCHMGDHSPQFDFDKYWQVIAH